MATITQADTYSGTIPEKIENKVKATFSLLPGEPVTIAMEITPFHDTEASTTNFKTQFSKAQVSGLRAAFLKLDMTEKRHDNVR